MEWYYVSENNNVGERCGQYPVCPSAQNPTCPWRDFCGVEGGGGCSSKSCLIKW